MIRIFKNELIKYFKNKWIIYSLTIIFSVITLGIIRKVSSSCTSSYLQLVTNFINIKTVDSGVMAFIIPITTIIITNSIISEDYECGAMKFSLISNISRKQLLLGKILAIFCILLINIITVFIASSIVSGFLNYSFKGFFSMENLKLFGDYLLMSLSIIPIYLFSILIGLIVDKFEKSVSLSIILFFISYIIDNLLIKVKFLSLTYGVIHLMFITETPHFLMYKSLVFSIIYSIIIIIANITIIKRKDFFI